MALAKALDELYADLSAADERNGEVGPGSFGGRLSPGRLLMRDQHDSAAFEFASARQFASRGIGMETSGNAALPQVG